MKILCTAVALCVAGLMAGAVAPAGAADQKVVVKAPVAPVVVCSNLNWSHGWVDHGGWGGWGYQDGLMINGWPGSCSVAVGAGPYAMVPREDQRKR